MRIVGTVLGGIIFLFLLTILGGSWYTIDQTQRGVLLRNGAFVGVMPPGLHGKWPWIESVYKIDLQTHNTTYGTSKEDAMEAYSSDQQPANLRVSVTYHVQPDKVEEMYNRFAGDLQAAVTRLISPHVHQEVKVVFGQYTAQKAITERGKLNLDAANALIGALAYDPIFQIEGVQVEDIGFSQDYIKAVETRMQAEVQVQQQEQNLRQERIKADIAVTQATGRANSVKAEAEAEAYKTTAIGNAQATAIKARADALAANTKLIELTQAERWDGKLPTTMVPGGAVPFLNVGR